MSDKQGQDNPPAYGQPPGDATPSRQPQPQLYSQPTTSYGSTPVYQRPHSHYEGLPVHNVYMSPCVQGHHVSSVRFGLCGILAAIFCFPIGFICMCLDTERVCARCGIRM